MIRERSSNTIIPISHSHPLTLSCLLRPVLTLVSPDSTEGGGTSDPIASVLGQRGRLRHMMNASVCQSVRAAQARRSAPMPSSHPSPFRG